MAGDEAKIQSWRFYIDQHEKLEPAVAVEFPLTIIFNGQELVTLLCTPSNLEALAAGYLNSEGLIDTAGDIKRILTDAGKGIVRIDTVNPVTLEQNPAFRRLIASGCGRGASLYSSNDALIPPVTNDMIVEPGKIIGWVDEFQHYSKLYQNTHGVHSAALCSSSGIAVFFEDIGRHNTLDKIFGQALIKNIELGGKIVITSGRMSSDSVYKVAKRGLPVLVSVSAPTDLAVKIAHDLNMTLVGRVNRSKMDVYTHPERIQNTNKHD